MTEEESRKLRELHAQIEELREELQAQREVRDYFMKPPLPGQPTRAEIIDEMLSGYKGVKWTSRVTFWIAGFVVAVAAAFNVFGNTK